MKNETNDRLQAMRTKVSGVLSVKPQCFITHPSELHTFGALSPVELREFAESNGWRVIRRVGGRQIEFYNDATVLRGRFTAQ